MKELADEFAYIRKAIINLAGLISTVISFGLVPEPWNKYATLGVLVATVVLHFEVPNKVTLPEGWGPLPKAITTGAERVSAYVQEAVDRLETIEGEVVEPETNPIPVVQHDDTTGIPVVDGETEAPAQVVAPAAGPVTTVEGIIDRLKAEGTLSSAY